MLPKIPTTNAALIQQTIDASPAFGGKADMRVGPVEYALMTERFF
jgi:hypothetical protein